MESSIGELMLSGVKLMLLGMSIVYLFLALLVWVIGATSRLIRRYGPEPSAHYPNPVPSQPAADIEPSEAELVSIISAAIHYHQNR